MNELLTGQFCFQRNPCVLRSFLRTMFFEKTRFRTYRSPFLIEMSNAGRKFSIEDGAYVERSQKSFKVDENS